MCIPQAILGMDAICQAKSGMGKTAVFVLSSLQQIDPVAGHVTAIVLCHTRELAYLICNEFERFSKYLFELKVAVFYGGVHIKKHKDLLKNDCPHIVVNLFQFMEVPVETPILRIQKYICLFKLIIDSNATEIFLMLLRYSVFLYSREQTEQGGWS